MLSDSEILDNKTQSLDEALQKLEANRDSDEAGPVEAKVHDVFDNDQLEIAVECVRTLADLYATVSNEGVSSYDVQVLRAVQAKMGPIRESTGVVKVALERYEGMFTPDRSGLNQSVSIEAIQIEFGKIIREWFYKLVDFIANIVNWAVRLKNSEGQLMQRSRKLRERLQTARGLLRDLMGRNINGTRDLTPQFKAIQDELLKDPKLPHNKITLMGFGPSQLNKDFGKELRTINTFTGVFRDIVTDLSIAVESGAGSTTGVLFTGRVLEDAIKELDQFVTEDPDPDYFLKSPLLEGIDLMRPKNVMLCELYYVSTWYNQLDTIVSSLKKIKRFDGVKDEATADKVAASIADINIGIKAIQTVIKTVTEINVSYFKVLATYFNYYTSCYEVVKADYSEHGIDDLQRVTMEQVEKKWKKMLQELGIFG